MKSEIEQIFDSLNCSKRNLQFINEEERVILCKTIEILLQSNIQCQQFKDDLEREFRR